MAATAPRRAASPAAVAALPLLLAGVLAIALADRSVMPMASVALERDLGLSASAAGLLINAYAIAQATTIAGASHLARLVGARRVLVVGILVGMSGTLLVAVASDETVIVMGRVLAGVGMAAALPASLAMVSSTAPGGDVGRAVGRYLAAANVVMVAAPLAAGVLIEHSSWRLVFVVEALLLVPSLVAALFLVPDRPRPARGAREGLGLAPLIAAIALGPLAIGLQQAGVAGWTSPRVLALLGIGVGALVVLALHDRRSSNPLVDSRVLRNRAVLRDAASTFGLGGVLSMVLVFGALFLSTTAGFSPTGTALMLALLLGPQAVVARMGGVLYDRVGFHRVATAGAPLLVVGATVLALGVRADSDALVAVGLVVTGIALGLLVSITSSDPMRQVDAALRPETSGLISTARTFGGAAVVALGLTLAHGHGAVAPLVLAAVLAVLLLPVLLWRAGAPDPEARP